MASEVKIILSADDKASANVKNVSAALGSMGTKAKEATDNLGAMNKMMQAEALVNAGRALGGVADKIGNSVKKLITEYGDYAEATKKMARLTGATTEEASRLIQVGDDLRITVDEMTTAMQQAARKGIDVSTDSLAKMSDQYLAMQPGLERSQWLMENFGRSGMSMAPLLEIGSASIRSMSAAIDQNLVVTDAQFAKFREGFGAVDEFNDKIQGLRFSIAVDLINAFNSIPGPAQNFVLGVSAIGPQLTGSIQVVADLTMALTNLSILFKAGGLLAGAPLIMKAIGVAALGAVAPFLPLIAAVGLLIVVLQKFGAQAWNTINMIGNLMRAFARLSAIRGASTPSIYTQQPTGFPGVPPASTGGGGGYILPNTLRAQGGNFTVPPGYPNDSYLAGLTSGERVSVTPPGKKGGGQNVVINLNYSPAISMADRFELETKLKPILRDAMRGL